jgi:UDP-glucose 4-epimerase
MGSLRKILVTGGAGYIGAHTAVELIQRGYSPVIIDNFSKSDRTLLHGIEKITGTQVNLHEGDCADKSFLRNVLDAEKDIVAVMHFAAYKSVGESVQQPLKYYENNIGSLISLLEVMREKRVLNFIFSSSCTVYGQPDHIPVDETAPFKKAESPYGATKQMCEQILEDTVSSAKDLHVISLRYFNPVGAHPTALIGELPLDVPGNLVPFITQTAAGIRKKLIIFGNDYSTPDGTCLRDFIHIVDLAEAHVTALGKMLEAPGSGGFEVYNLGTGSGVSVLDLVKKFIAITNVSFPYEIGPRRPGDVEKTYADPTKAFTQLGWKTKYTIEEALLHAWNWQKKISNPGS